MGRGHDQQQTVKRHKTSIVYEGTGVNVGIDLAGGSMTYREAKGVGADESIDGFTFEYPWE